MDDGVEVAVVVPVKDRRPVWLGLCWLAAAAVMTAGCVIEFGAGTGLIVCGAVLGLLAWLVFGDV